VTYRQLNSKLEIQEKNINDRMLKKCRINSRENVNMEKLKKLNVERMKK